ncbi:hypothetical protein L3C95_11245 [Chitinophaga filiformis]|uniref:AAA-like domain-containing protein n=1 Tax=Chitinophaga filiformis TaxID=104663 RepID=UPI001F2D1FDA|nr:AAA-like domain-containing protein [Chitinophaga filiformis]MCF6402627.1 hypothetical protein [Chitinophaga filiformis]MCF6403455.1 hypothetical protein [Chitinophaga filiformis]
MNWLSPNTITGDAATAGRYFRRERINEEFWREIKKGNHILFVAPRRVGKTSIMMDLAENCTDQYVCIYQNIEGVTSRSEFYQRLFTLVIQCLNRSRVQSVKSYLQSCFKKYAIEEITTSGLKLKTSELNYELELQNLILSLEETKVHTILFLDEFAEVISRMSKSDQKEDAIAILHTLREIRSYKKFKNFSIVYAGSVGLEFVIRNIDRPKLINDLHPIQTDALTNHETRQFIQQLTKDATISLSEPAIAYLIKVVEHTLPYYIQLMLEEIDHLARQQNKPEISTSDIDNAFENVLKKNKNFEDWLERLKDYQSVNFKFVNEILKHAAHREQITIREIYDIACHDSYKRQDDYMDFIDQLTNDGYLIESPRHVYKFISPFLKRFWLRKYPVYYEQFNLSTTSLLSIG